MSYSDNRLSVAVVTYDGDDLIDYQEESGARYIYETSLDSDSETATFTGQSDNTVTIPWSDLRLP